MRTRNHQTETENHISLGWTGQQNPRSSRGVIESLGFFLIFSLVVVSVAVSSVVIIENMSEQKQDYRQSNAVNSMVMLANDVSAIYEGEAPKRQVRLQMYGGQLGTSGKTKMTVQVENSQNDQLLYTYGPTESNTLLLNPGIRGDMVVAYSYGSVIRVQNRGQASLEYVGSIMERDPPFRFTDQRVVLPIIDLDGSGTVSGDTIATAQFNRDRTELKYRGTADQYRITMKIETTRAQALAWKRYFERKGLTKHSDTNVNDGVVVYQYTTERVTIQRLIINTNVEI